HVLLPGQQGTRVAATHRHDDVRPLDVLLPDRLRVQRRYVDVDLLQRLDDGLVELGFGPGAGGTCLAAEPLVERLRHLRAPCVAYADEVRALHATAGSPASANASRSTAPG